MKRQTIKIVIAGITILMLSCICSSSPSLQPTSNAPTLTSDQIKFNARSDITYDDLSRDTENYIGEIIFYKGQVVQVMERSGLKVYLRVNVTEGEYGFWDDTIFVNYEGPRVLEDDIVNIWGKVEGRYTYTAVLGNKITIPEISALILEIDSP
jgi:hypothetical protein